MSLPTVTDPPASGHQQKALMAIFYTLLCLFTVTKPKRENFLIEGDFGPINFRCMFSAWCDILSKIANKLFLCYKGGS